MTDSQSNALAKHKVVLYFDVFSPYVRIALTTLRRYAQPWGLDLDLQPVSLKFIMKYAENHAPASIPNKGRWMMQDVPMASKLYGVTLNKPAKFPISTVNAQSVLRLVKQEQPAYLDKAIDAFYDALWTNDEYSPEVERMEAILTKAKVFEETDKEIWQALLQRAMTEENQTALDKECQDLVENGGAFGAPWIVVTRKSDGKTVKFFGSDRTETIAAFLHEPYRGPRADGSQPEL